MTMRMLIDARHREETRVAVVKGNRIEEFDFESADHKQLKGNIYLAKVTRVEPSLQAAFVDYGGNRHGFLAFSEIHPDYYQIPKEDREALLREEAEHAAEEERLRSVEDDLDPIDGHHEDDGHDDQPFDPDVEGEHHDDDAPPAAATASGNGIDEKAVDALRAKRMNLRRRYKIQDVIRRRQVLLVQVVKEERGNKGAALTTYLSLAGRYCVLMPNTSHGGGISRKISNAADRKRLKVIMAELNLPRTMGCIVRTAGLQRTKVEIRRDFDYLARLWDEIRDKTLGSAAPALIYQDSDLIKRAIRDLYNKDIEEVIVEGAEGYGHAKQFMKLLMPSHARRVKPYVDTVPLFQRNHVEDQLAAMYNPVVQLKSGGYLVINPTEALVSIDINSGRSTREYGIEATAVGTNLEAAHEIARQLRLRDMAGLVVIDFIDMENNSNIRKVEKTMKAALSDDRARIQVGRISSFGLMEMSRQRLRTGVLEASTRQCPHCEGTGLVRTASSAGLSALRMLEDEAGRGRGSKLVLMASREAALYVLNKKRGELAEIEARYGVIIEVASDNEDEGARMTVEVSGPPPVFTPRLDPPVYEEEDEDPEDFVEEDDGQEPEGEQRDGEREVRDDGEAGRGRRRRRRGKRARPDDDRPAEVAQADLLDGDSAAEDDEPERDANVAVDRPAEAAGETGDRKRRGRRGGRRRRGRGGADRELRTDSPEGETVDANDDEPAEVEAFEEAPAETEPAVEPVKPKRTRKAKAPEVEAAPELVLGSNADLIVAEASEKPKRTRRKKVETEPIAELAADDGEAAPAVKPKRTRKPKVDETVAAPDFETVPVTAAPDAAKAANDANNANDDAAKRGGWWQRTFGATS